MTAYGGMGEGVQGVSVLVLLTRILSSVLPLLVSCLMARTNLTACLSSTFLMLSKDAKRRKKRGKTSNYIM